MPSATGQFYVSNGQIIDPNGQNFTARGVNVLEGIEPSVAALTGNFPGVNFVRLAIYDYASPSALSAYVSQLTSAGIVVELEDHTNSTGSDAGGNTGNIFTGQQLTNELNWYASVAAAFKGNSNVWFGTDNEPSQTDSSGNSNPAALSTWQQQTYNAIRGTGNTAPVMVEMNGYSPASMGQGYTPSVYAAMSNIVWDVHYYGWISGFSTDQATVTQTLLDCDTQSQTLKTASGTAPVIIGEYGNSTTGSAVDANGSQVVTAVQSAVANGSAKGAAAWAYFTGGPGDGLINGNGSLSSYGQQVAAGIAAEAATAPPPVTPPPVTPPGSPSPNDTVVLAGSTKAITDASGNKWTITGGGQVALNGAADATTNHVIELAYVNGAIWQENASKLWWDKTSPSASWSPTNGTSTSPLPTTPPPSPTATITVRVSEDYYQGDAQFTVKVDGVQVGATLTASALHASGDSNVFVLTGNWSSGTHPSTIEFINDAYGGSPTTDRNLYVDSIAYNGHTQIGSAVALYSNGARTFNVGQGVTTAAGPADTVTLHLAEDAYNGNAKFQFLVDGKVVTTPQEVVAQHSAGAWQDLSFSGNFGAGSHTIGVKFTNDAYGGSLTTDRNLYVNGIDVNGTHYGSGVTNLFQSSTASFAVVTQH